MTVKQEASTYWETLARMTLPTAVVENLRRVLTREAAVLNREPFWHSLLVRAAGASPGRYELEVIGLCCEGCGNMPCLTESLALPFGPDEFQACYRLTQRMHVMGHEVRFGYKGDKRFDCEFDLIAKS